MTPATTLLIMLAYVALLYTVSLWTSRHASAAAFYTAERKTPWYLVSYGMIGVAISGITFISVPGEVINSGFTYFQLVIGYAIGLILVALLLLPLFYHRRLISIYSYLKDRFGNRTHKTGVALFIIAHALGAAFRLYLMAYVLQLIIFDAVGIPFSLTVFLTLLLIWFYTYRGGIKTVIFTDVLQTSFLLLAAIVGVFAVAKQLDVSLVMLQRNVWALDGMTIFDWSWKSPNNFFKLVVTGAVLTATNNGLDQAIMQKHLTCPTLGEAQKNVLVLSGILLVVNLLFLFLGGALIFYATEHGISLPAQTDQLYPLLTTEHLGGSAAIMFVIGLTAAAYSSADTSLTGLTTSFCVDFLGFERNRPDNPRTRMLVHLGFSLLIFVFIIFFRLLNDQSVISAFIVISGYAYGPLLGLFAFGMITRRKIPDQWVPALCVIAPVVAWLVDFYAERLFGFALNYETILVNAAITMLGLLVLSFSTDQS